MKKPSHTPGPWVSRKDILTGQRKVTDSPFNNNLFYGEMPWDEYPDEQAEADAQLAAAAPQLAEALINSVKERAFSAALSCGKTAYAANQYSESDWLLHLNNNEQSALTAAGYLNDESND